MVHTIGTCKSFVRVASSIVASMASSFLRNITTKKISHPALSVKLYPLGFHSAWSYILGLTQDHSGPAIPLWEGSEGCTSATDLEQCSRRRSHTKNSPGCLPD